MNGTVRSVTYFGSMQRVIVDASDGTEIEVDMDVWRNRETLNQGDAVDLFWKDDAAVELQAG